MKYREEHIHALRQIHTPEQLAVIVSALSVQVSTEVYAGQQAKTRPQKMIALQRAQAVQELTNMYSIACTGMEFDDFLKVKKQDK